MVLTATSSCDSKACVHFNYSRRYKLFCRKYLTLGYRQHSGTPLAACDCLLKMNAAETASCVELHEQSLRERCQSKLPWTGASSTCGFEANSSMKVLPQFVWSTEIYITACSLFIIFAFLGLVWVSSNANLWLFLLSLSNLSNQPRWSPCNPKERCNPRSLASSLNFIIMFNRNNNRLVNVALMLLGVLLQC